MLCISSEPSPGTWSCWIDVEVVEAEADDFDNDGDLDSGFEMEFMVRKWKRLAN